MVFQALSIYSHHSLEPFSLAQTLKESNRSLPSLLRSMVNLTACHDDQLGRLAADGCLALFLVKWMMEDEGVRTWTFPITLLAESAKDQLHFDVSNGR